mmetsp:Transcript_3392/g.7251  ORF Transcript_3392/g.7251 Transcript_3392/m.7251 type:complete len:203 (-) Transcript_3392:74-682(-)
MDEDRRLGADCGRFWRLCCVWRSRNTAMRSLLLMSATSGTCICRSRNSAIKSSLVKLAISAASGDPTAEIGGDEDSAELRRIGVSVNTMLARLCCEASLSSLMDMEVTDALVGRNATRFSFCFGPGKAILPTVGAERAEVEAAATESAPPRRDDEEQNEPALWGLSWGLRPVGVGGRGGALETDGGSGGAERTEEASSTFPL